MPDLEVLDELREDAVKYDFFQAMRLLECTHPEKPRIGTSQRPCDDPVRLGQEPSVAFSPSSLANVEPGSQGRPWRMNVRFFGMFGPNGPLPLHLTEYARQRARQEFDPTLGRFMDVFHHRMLCLFYRAWADAQPVVSFDRPDEDRFSAYVGSTFGIANPEMRDRDAMPDLAKLSYAGRLASQTKCPDGLRAMISDFFQLPVEIDEFVGQWTELPADFRCSLGETDGMAQLGRTATIGSHVWDCQQKFRITLGPMNWNDYRRLLPDGESLERLTALVRNYIGDELMWEVNLILKHEETPTASLGGNASLGRSAWLSPEDIERDANDLTLRLDRCAN